MLFNAVYDNCNITIPLSAIPRIIEFEPQRNISLRVLGIVDLKISNIPRSESDIGHYMALSWRQDGSWVRYDDWNPTAGKRVPVHLTKVNPALLITKKITN